MLAALALGAFAYSLMPLAARPPLWLALALGVAALGWVLVQPPQMQRDDTLPALAFAISALGIMTIGRLAPGLAQKQCGWLLASLIFAALLGPIFTEIRRFASIKYLWVIVSVVLFVALLIFGHEVNGARLWIRVGPMQFEPVEAIKLFMVFFMAAYLAETADVIAAARPWALGSHAKYLGPLVLGWGLSMGILVVQRDLGMAALFLGIFVASLYMATRRIDIITLGFVLFGLAAFWSYAHFGYVRARVEVWQHPFADPLGRGYQALMGLFSLAAGGLFGTGYQLGAPRYIPDAATDYIYAAWSEEFGLLGAGLLLAAYAIIVARSLRIAMQQPDLYAKLLAGGLAATLGFQVVIIGGGVLRLFPLTGITLPFFSYGGSSLIANVFLVAILWAISARPLHVPEGTAR